MKNKLLKRANGGFSLVELIVVIAIMAILVGVAVPVYSSYIEKAEISKDKQLVDEVAHAIQIGQAAGGNFGASYIILTTEDASVSNATLEAHLKTVFGDDLSGLKLSYDGWKIKSGVIAEALLANTEAINNSSYLNNSSVNELLGNVQTVTSAAAGLLGSVTKTESSYINALKAALGDDYLQNAVAAGIMTGNETDGYHLVGAETVDGNVVVSADLQNQLANLMVFDVAAKLENADQQQMMYLMVYGLPEMDVELPAGYNEADALAARYAIYKAYALDNNKSEDFDAMNEALKNASGTEEVMNALNAFQSANVDGLDTYLTGEDGPSDVFATNADAIASIMGGVNSVAGDYSTADALKSPDLFTSGAVSSDVNAFVGVSALYSTLNDEQKAALQSVTNGVIIFVYADGSVVVVPTME